MRRVLILIWLVVLGCLGLGPQTAVGHLVNDQAIVFRSLPGGVSTNNVSVTRYYPGGYIGAVGMAQVNSSLMTIECANVSPLGPTGHLVTVGGTTDIGERYEIVISGSALAEADVYFAHSGNVDCVLDWVAPIAFTAYGVLIAGP